MYLSIIISLRSIFAALIKININCSIKYYLAYRIYIDKNVRLFLFIKIIACDYISNKYTISPIYRKLNLLKFLLFSWRLCLFPTYLNLILQMPTTVMSFISIILFVLGVVSTRLMN